MGGRSKGIHRFLGISLAVGLLLPGGCATRNYRAAYAGQMISQGERAVREAKAAHASQNAPEALAAAEEKLSKAKAAYAEEEHDDAANLAEEAVATAEFAQAQSTTEKNRETAEEMRKNIRVLQKEVGTQAK